MAEGTSRSDFKVVAQNHVIARAFADGQIDQQEASQLMATVLEETQPFSQIDLNFYLNLKNNFTQYQAMTKAPVPFEDKTQEQQFRYLLGSFPGSTVHFQADLKKDGLAQVRPDENLPEMGLHALKRDLQNPHNIVIEVNFEGQVQSVVYDTRFPLMQQTFLQDPVRQPLFFDALNLLTHIEYERLFLSEEQPIFYDLFRNLGIQPGLAGLFVFQAQVLGAQGAATMPRGSEMVLEEKNKFEPEESFPLDLYSDGSLTIEEANRIIQDVKEIVGEPLLNFLKEKGWRISFNDAASLSAQEQRQHQVQDKAVLSLSQPGISCTLLDGSHLIVMDTSGSVGAVTYVMVHELMHAIFEEVEGAANLKDVVFSQDIENGLLEPIRTNVSVGAYFANFATHIEQTGASLEDQPSNYGTSNEKEHFAEIGTQFLLERAGRKDLYQTRGDVNPRSYESLFFTNPIDYLMIAKIVQTIEQRESDPPSYETLLARGIDDDLFDACYRFYGQEQLAGTEVSEDKQKSTMEKWGGERLHALYQVDDGVEESEVFADNVRGLLKNHATQDVQDLFLPDSQGNYPMKPLVERFADFSLIQLACKMSKATSREERISIFKGHLFLGVDTLANRAALEMFYKALRYLDSKDVDTIINPDNLIDEVALAYQADFREYERWLKMERPDNPFAQ